MVGVRDTGFNILRSMFAFLLLVAKFLLCLGFVVGLVSPDMCRELGDAARARAAFGTFLGVAMVV
jgi:hypothetical protein